RVHCARGMALAPERRADTSMARRYGRAGWHSAGARAEAGMKTHPVMDVSGLSVYNNWTRAPLWWGFMGMIAIEATVFTSFIVSYFYLGAGHSSWPPLSHEPPKLLLPTINTIILVASSFVVHWGDRGI